MTFTEHDMNLTRTGTKFHENDAGQSMSNFKKSSRINYATSQASEFLKKSISSMIKQEMKAFHLKEKLQKELEAYKKSTEAKQMIADMHKVGKIREQEKQTMRKTYDNFVSQKHKKEQRIQALMQKKKQQAEEKKKLNSRKIMQVRNRFTQKQQQIISTRLSRVQSFSLSKPDKSLTASKVSFNSRKIASSQNHREKIRSRMDVNEIQRVTNYMRKMRGADSRILEKQLKNEERKQKSIRSEVKNLTQEKQIKEISMMKSMEQKLTSKFDTFYRSREKNHLQNSSTLMNKSFLRSQFRDKVLKRKEELQASVGNQTMESFMRKTSGKQNFTKIHRQKLDFLRSKSNFMSNTIQLEKEEMRKQNDKAMRVLYGKVKKLKTLKENEALSASQKMQLISLLDDSDPAYSEMAQFLSSTKSQFVKKKAERESEKAKAEKLKNANRFNK